jgi:aliphatic nitrilase
LGDDYPKFKAAAAQVAPVFLNREATIEKACNFIKDAGSKGASLIVFPECFVPSHPYWYIFFAAEEGTRLFYRELFKNSVEVPSPATDSLCQAAREAQVYAVVGITEKVHGTMGTLYNTQLFIDNKGNIMGKHRKLVPTNWERLVHAMGDGSTLKVFPTEFGELGGLICGENTNSLAKFAMFAQGEKIHAASWPAFPVAEEQVYTEGAHIRNRCYAFEGKVFVISSTGWFSDEMKETICKTEDAKKMVICGGGFSSIIGPYGEFLAGPYERGEGIIYAEIDMEKIIDAKATHDIIGHYNRFDVLSLWFNDKSNPAIRFTGQGDAEVMLAHENPEAQRTVGDISQTLQEKGSSVSQKTKASSKKLDF